MSLILDALRKAKSLAGGSAPPKAPAYLKSFGFTEQAPQNKVKKILVTYVLPVVVLESIIAAGVVYWISRTASSPMQQQVALLDAEGGLPAELVFDDPVTESDDPLAGESEAPGEDGTGSGEEVEAESTEAPAEATVTGEVTDPAIELEPETAPPPEVPVPEPPRFEPEPAPEEAVTENTLPDEPAVEAEADPVEDLLPATEGENEETLPPESTTTDQPPAPGGVQIGPSDADSFRLAVFYQQQGDFPKAIESYQQILNDNPLNAVVHNNVGLIHHDLSNHEEAIKSYRNAILVNETYDVAHNNLGITLMAEERNAEATGEFRRALELNSQNTSAMTNLGNLSKNAGKLEEAKFQYLRALQIDPALVEAHYNLAWIFEEQGEKGSAVQHLQRFLELGSGQYPDLVIEVERKIQELSRKEP